MTSRVQSRAYGTWTDAGLRVVCPACAQEHVIPDGSWHPEGESCEHYLGLYHSGEPGNPVAYFNAPAQEARV